MQEIESPLPLRGVVVLFLGGAVSYCGRLLAGLGGTSVLIEPLQGVRERCSPPFAPGPLGATSSLSFAFNATGMRSVAVDTRTADGADILRQALDRADVVVNALDWEEDSSWVQACEAALSRTSTPICTAGPDGPLVRLGADELLLQAAGGLLALNGFLDRAPVPVPGETARMQTALLAATAVLGSLAAATEERVPGRVRAQAGVALMTLQTANPGFYTWHGVVPKRAGIAGLAGMPYRCKDGYVTLTVPGERWGVFLGWLDELGIERSNLPTALDGQVESMRSALTQATASVTELASRFTKRELYHAAQSRGLLCMPANLLEEVLSDEHLAARDFFVKDLEGRGELSAPFRAEPQLWNMATSAPRLGDYTEDFCVDLLGLSRSEVEILFAMGVIACSH